MEIHVTTRPFKKMRYPTAGDYIYNPGVNLFYFIIAQMENTDYEALVFLHEFIEAYLCWKANIKEEDITAFDIRFEKDKKEGEPGDDPAAPYYKQHKIASRFEKMFCDALRVNWQEYDAAIENLFKE